MITQAQAEQLLELYNEFKPYADNLKKKGFNGEQKWWCSRYSEFLGINSKFSMEKWRKQRMWKELWKEYQNEIQEKTK